MKYSKIFGKSVRKPPSGAMMTSHKLLHQAGFVRESTAGRYYFLPLGWKVHDKIKKIIKTEMDKAEAQEMITPVLHPLDLWKETNRTATTGFELMKVKDARGSEFALGGTAEEMFVDLVRKFKLSYRDLPFNIYQFSTKFRDEMRARGGLLRVREFVMKDAYSFDKDEKEFNKVYQEMANTYTNIFNLMGLETKKVEADNGYIGGEYCHEFQVESSNGEGKFFVSENDEYCAHEDVVKFKRENINTDEKMGKFEIFKQPKWVKTMDDNVKHYKLPKSRFLKNVVYTNRITKEVIIAVIRGDLDVNKVKLEHALNAVGQLEESTEEDLKRIGTKPGYVHSWGHKKAVYIGDFSLETVHNFYGGQKEDETDSKNVNYSRDFSCKKLADIASCKEGFFTEDGANKLIKKRGIEVGNIFQLGYHYTHLMKGADFTDEEGVKKPFYMGCYGIGLGRTMAAIVEVYNDEKGIVWPESVAPYLVHLISLSGAGKNGEKVYNQMLNKNIEVLWDDRDVSAGVKFTDADLIGIPYRLVVSAKTGDKVEIKKRNEKDAKLLSIEEFIRKLAS
ncbi:proline--tRNA ligase [Patescibacteria group bacterium]